MNYKMTLRRSDSYYEYNNNISQLKYHILYANKVIDALYYDIIDF
jgi:hypothetical protein